MRKFLYVLVGVAGLAMAGGSQAATRAVPHISPTTSAALSVDAVPNVQLAQYYGGYRHHWREREWRRHNRWRRHEQRRRWRHHRRYYRGW